LNVSAQKSGSARRLNVRKTRSFAYKEDDLFKMAIKHLDLARTHFKSSIGIAKTWLIQSELIVDIAEKSPLILDHIETSLLIDQDENLYNQLKLNLSLTIESFIKQDEHTNNQCDVLFTKGLYYLSKVLFKLEEYQQCRMQVIKCMSYLRELQQKKLFSKAQNLLLRVSKVIQIEVNNLFIFAKSCPIRERSKVNEFLLQKHIQDLPMELKTKLAASQYQIDLKFSVLTIRFLESIRDSGCKILHLTPNMFKVSEDKCYMLVEDYQFKPVQLTPAELKKCLQPEEGALQVSLVFLEMANCEEFCKVFLDLGVHDVVSFTYEGLLYDNDLATDSIHYSNTDLNEHTSSDDNRIEKHKMQLSDQLLSASQFLFHFCNDFYPLLLDGLTIKQAIDQAELFAREQISKQIGNLSNLKMNICLFSVKSNQKLFDNDSSNVSKNIYDGVLCDVSDLRGQSNIIFERYLAPYLMRQAGQIQKLMDLLTNEALYNEKLNRKRQFDGGISPRMSRAKSGDQFSLSNNCINIYGQRGVGKSRMVMEALYFLRYRYIFCSGIYMVDLKKVANFGQMHDILKEYVNQEELSSQHDQNEGTPS